MAHGDSGSKPDMPSRGSVLPVLISYLGEEKMRIHMPINLVKAIIKAPDGCASFEDRNGFTAHTHIPFYDALVLYSTSVDAGDKLLTIDDESYIPA